MALQLQVTTNALQVRDVLGRIRSNLPKATDKDVKKIALIYSRALRTQVREQGMNFTGNLSDSLRRVRKTKKGYSIGAPRYALNLSFKKGPHWVGPDTPGRESLDKWMIQHTGSTRPFIRVNPKPWVQPGLRVGTKRALRYFENSSMEKLITSKGMKT